MSPIIPPARYFVYLLKRPDGRVFYVGKGTGNRPLRHIREAQTGTCICPKCKIIQGLLRLGKEPVIEHIHCTDNERDAYAVELTTIRALGLQYRLCNKNAPRPEPPRSRGDMTFREYMAWLDHIDATDKEKMKEARWWFDVRVPGIRREIKGARLRGERDRMHALQADIEDAIKYVGKVRQLELDPYTIPD